MTVPPPPFGANDHSGVELETKAEATKLSFPCSVWVLTPTKSYLPQFLVFYFHSQNTFKACDLPLLPLKEGRVQSGRGRSVSSNIDTTCLALSAPQSFWSIHWLILQHRQCTLMEKKKKKRTHLTDLKKSSKSWRAKTWWAIKIDCEQTWREKADITKPRHMESLIYERNTIINVVSKASSD